MNVDKLLKISDIVLKVAFVFLVALLLLLMYGAYEDYNRKLEFDKQCFDAGGIPLRYTYYYDRKQNRIEYTCLSVNAIVDID